MKPIITALLAIAATAAHAKDMDIEFNGMDWTDDNHRVYFFSGVVIGAGARLGFQGWRGHDFDRLAVTTFCGFWLGALVECMTNDADDPNADIDLGNATMMSLGALTGGTVVYGGMLIWGPSKDGATLMWEAKW